MKYQCYYNETLYVESNEGMPVPVVGAKVIVEDAVFDTETEAEQYCEAHFGVQQIGNEFIENDMRYEEVEA